MSWLRRKWRSVSFRSGLGASLIVGIIVALGLFILSASVFLTLYVASAIVPVSLMNRMENQLQVGVDPQDIQIDDPTGFLLETGFWAVTINDGGEAGAVVSSGGNFDQSVLDAPFDDLNLGISVEISDEFDRSGTKSIDGTQWLLVEELIEVGEADYVLIAGEPGEYRLRSFIGDGLPVLIPVLLVVMAVAGLITSWFTRRALGSVEKMRREVEQITQESLDRRVPTTGAQDRIDKLAETMNDMLTRLESSTVQQNRFLADASHELRSPVAGLLAQLDVAAAYPDRADTATLIPKLQREAQRLQQVLDDLLLLSRFEAKQALPPPVAVDLDALVVAELEHQRMMNPNLTVERRGSSDATVVGVERDLQRALRNLADNASRHANERIVLGLAGDAEAVTLTVADDGDGIAAEDADRVFDRFVRLDESRTRDAGGSGLGLAIVREIVEAHGGTVGLVSTAPGSGASFAIRLPVAGPTDS